LHIPLLAPKNIIRRILIKAPNIAANIIYKRKPIINPHSGCDDFSWHRSVVEYILTFVKDNPKYVKRFRHTNCPAEKFFHTILHKKTDLLNIEKYKSLTFVQWKSRENKTLHLAHPVVLDERDYDDVINSGAVFCRKILPVQSAKLISLFKERIY